MTDRVVLPDQAGDIPGLDRLAFYTLEGGPAGNPIEIQLIGEDFNRLQQAADELKAELGTFPGVIDIADDFKPGKEEKRVNIKEGAKSLGVSMLNIARQIRQAFYGEEALRIQRGKDDVKVVVRYAEDERRSYAGFEEMRIRTLDGRQIPIEEVAEITPGRGPSSRMVPAITIWTPCRMQAAIMPSFTTPDSTAF